MKSISSNNLSILMIMLCQVVNVNGFSSLSLQSTPTLTSSIKSNEFSRARMSTTSMNMNMISDDNKQIQDIKKGVTSLTFAAMIALSTAGVTPGVAQAYEDYTEMNDIETVETVIKSLKESSGNAKASFKTFESISDIITEGKGVGGMISSCKYLYLYLQYRAVHAMQSSNCIQCINFFCNDMRILFYCT